MTYFRRLCYKFILNPLSKGLDSLVDIVNLLHVSHGSNDSFLDNRFIEMTKNPVDRRNVDEAVEYLRRNRDIRSKNVTLTNNTSITISIVDF